MVKKNYFQGENNMGQSQSVEGDGKNKNKSMNSRLWTDLCPMVDIQVT